MTRLALGHASPGPIAGPETVRRCSMELELAPRAGLEPATQRLTEVSVLHPSGEHRSLTSVAIRIQCYFSDA